MQLRIPYVLIFLSWFFLKAEGQVAVTDQSFRDAKEVRVKSFVPAIVVFENDSIVNTLISIQSNANYKAGYISHVVFTNNLPTDTAGSIKVSELKKFTAGQGIKYLEFQGIKAVFQKIGFMTFLTRVLYEDDYSRLSSLFPYDVATLALATIQKSPYNTYIQFKKNGRFNEQGDLMGIYSPSFGARRSEKAFVKYFDEYPELVNTIKAKTFLFDAPSIMKLLEDYSLLKAK